MLLCNQRQLNLIPSPDQHLVLTLVLPSGGSLVSHTQVQKWFKKLRDLLWEAHQYLRTCCCVAFALLCAVKGFDQRREKTDIRRSACQMATSPNQLLSYCCGAKAEDGAREVYHHRHHPSIGCFQTELFLCPGHRRNALKWCFQMT